MLEDVAAQEEMQQGPNAVLDDAEDALEKFNAARKKLKNNLVLGITSMKILSSMRFCLKNCVVW